MNLAIVVGKEPSTIHEGVGLDSNQTGGGPVLAGFCPEQIACN